MAEPGIGSGRKEASESIEEGSVVEEEEVSEGQEEASLPSIQHCHGVC